MFIHKLDLWANFYVNVNSVQGLHYQQKKVFVKDILSMVKLYFWESLLLAGTKYVRSGLQLLCL